LSAKLIANRSDRHLANLSNSQGTKARSHDQEKVWISIMAPERNAALLQKAGYTTATGRPEQQRPCARGWVHTREFEFHYLRQGVSRLRPSPGRCANLTRVGPKSAQ
jgi:hypothetical protein